MKQKLITLFVLLLGFIVACSDPTILSPCGAPCYSGPAQTENVGECRSGFVVCTSTTSFCGDEVLPHEETCASGLDTDCNGVVGDDPSAGYSCGPSAIGDCRPGHWLCQDAQFICADFIAPATIDSCGDRRDNDCDGLIDNTKPTPCYTGDPNDLASPAGICRPGIEFCIDSQPLCLNEVLPAQEVCNGRFLDEDCNGIVDDIPFPTSIPTDFVFLVDRSSSMNTEIINVRQALVSFMLAYNNSGLYRYALVDVPGPNFAVEPVVLVGLSGASQVIPFAAQLDASYGGDEASYDAITWSVDGTFDFEWRASANHVVVFFGDEPGQTHHSLDEVSTTNAVLTFGAQCVVFAYPLYFDNYDDLSTRTGGGPPVDVSSSAQDMLTKLISLVSQACQQP